MNIKVAAFTVSEKSNNTSYVYAVTFVCASCLLFKEIVTPDCSFNLSIAREN